MFNKDCENDVPPEKVNLFRGLRLTIVILFGINIVLFIVVCVLFIRKTLLQRENEWRDAYLHIVGHTTENAYDDYFALIYIDGDKIPELFHSAGGTVSLYTYHAGKAVNVFQDCYDFVPYSFIPHDGLIYCPRYYGEDEIVYKLSRGKLKEMWKGEVLRGIEDPEDHDIIYCSNGVEVSYERFILDRDKAFDHEQEIIVIDPDFYHFYSDNENMICGIKYQEMVYLLLSS